MDTTKTESTTGVALYLSLRRHGESVTRAAYRAHLTFDRAMRVEGYRYCEACQDYVRDDACPHWDYEG